MFSKGSCRMRKVGKSIITRGPEVGIPLVAFNCYVNINIGIIDCQRFTKTLDQIKVRAVLHCKLKFCYNSEGLLH